MSDPRILHDDSIDGYFIDDIPSMIAKSKEIALDFAFDHEALLKHARLRDDINYRVSRAFYASAELHLYFQADANLNYGERVIGPRVNA